HETCPAAATRSARHDLTVLCRLPGGGPLPGLAEPVPIRTQLVPGRGRVKSAEEIMNILEAYDLTGSLRDAAELAGCSHPTVARYVAARDAGGVSDRPEARARLIDEFWPKLEEWMERFGRQDPRRCGA